MVSLHVSVLGSLAMSLLSAVGTNAANIGSCTDSNCGACPVYHDTLTYPNCWAVSVDNLDNKGNELKPAGGYIVFLDTPQPDAGCAYVIGSGSDCGATVGRYENAICIRQAWTTTLGFTQCCGECGGVGARIEGTPVQANLIDIRAVAKRDYSTWTSTSNQEDGYGSAQAVSNPLTGPADVQIQKTVTTGRSSTFSASIGDPYCVASVSTGITESTSTALSYTFQVLESQSGYVAWTPLVTCVDGTLSGCDGASDEAGRLCTPKKDSSGEVVGQYTFVLLLRVVRPLKV